MLRPSAPDDLVDIETLCNSVNRLRGGDELATVASANGWLRERGYDVEIDEPGRLRIVEAREVLRAHLVDRTDPVALESLNALIAGELSAPSIGADGVVRFAPRAGGDARGGGGVRDGPGINSGTGAASAVLARVLGTVVSARLAGRDIRLKACRAPECQWLFYDRSPAQAGVWCNMDVCGARHKMATYRAKV